MNVRSDEPSDARPRVAIFAPNPLLTVTIEDRGGADDLRLHAGGQGVWVARMTSELGAEPVLCGFIGGETGDVLSGLLDELPGECRLTETAERSGAYVIDRRSGEVRPVASSFGGPPSRHEVDSLVSAACAAALDSGTLVVCNPYPADIVPQETFSKLVTDAQVNDVDVIVDLSSPRLECALEGKPDVVKLNEWELGEFFRASAQAEETRFEAVSRLRDAGARSVLVTRGGEAAYAYRDGEVLEISPPRFDEGSREGCGDSMTGAIAAARARGLDWRETLVLGAAAGAANYLHHDLGTGARDVVEGLTDQVEVRPV